MTSMNLKFLLPATALILSAAFFSCRKDKNDNQEDNDTSDAADNTFSQQCYNDLGTMADEALRNGTSNTYKFTNPNSVLSVCASVDLQSGTKVPFSVDGKDTITVNFGATNCLCNDGRYRRGTVQFTYTGAYRTTGTVITVNPINYFVNDNSVQGSKTITNLGSGSGYQMRHTIVVNGTIVKANGGGTITWSANRTRDWVSGDTTFMWDDDVYHISGSASGSKVNGNTYTSTITNPLVRKFDLTNPVCKKYFVQGTLNHQPANKPVRVIDFGNGACDNIATITINGQTYTIQMQ